MPLNGRRCDVLLLEHEHARSREPLHLRPRNEAYPVLTFEGPDVERVAVSLPASAKGIRP